MTVMIVLMAVAIGAALLSLAASAVVWRHWKRAEAAHERQVESLERQVKLQEALAAALESQLKVERLANVIKVAPQTPPIFQ
jgi:hypothetical protein